MTDTARKEVEELVEALNYVSGYLKAYNHATGKGKGVLKIVYEALSKASKLTEEKTNGS